MDVISKTNGHKKSGLKADMFTALRVSQSLALGRAYKFYCCWGGGGYQTTGVHCRQERDNTYYAKIICNLDNNVRVCPISASHPVFTSPITVCFRLLF